MSDDKVLLLQSKLDNHIENFDAHCANEEKRWDHLISAQEHNSECIKELTRSTQALTNSTEGVVSAWNAANGTVKTMSALSKFIKWLSSFAVIGVFVTWFIDKYHF